jgi:hypothetical protein
MGGTGRRELKPDRLARIAVVLQVFPIGPGELALTVSWAPLATGSGLASVVSCAAR